MRGRALGVLLIGCAPLGAGASPAPAACIEAVAVRGDVYGVIGALPSTATLGAALADVTVPSCDDTPRFDAQGNPVVVSPPPARPVEGHEIAGVNPRLAVAAGGPGQRRLAVMDATPCRRTTSAAACLAVLRSRSRYRLVLDPVSARPGDTIRARVISPPGSRPVYGLAAELLRLERDRGRWVPAYHLQYALPSEPFSRPSATPADQPVAVRLIGLFGPEPRELLVPADAPPGRYRITKDLNGGRRLVAELTVLPL